MPKVLKSWCMCEGKPERRKVICSKAFSVSKGRKACCKTGGHLGPAFLTLTNSSVGRLTISSQRAAGAGSTTERRPADRPGQQWPAVASGAAARTAASGQAGGEAAKALVAPSISRSLMATPIYQAGLYGGKGRCNGLIFH